MLVELRGQSALAGVLRNSDVRAILGGHLHYSTTATFAGIPVSVASATCYTQDLNVPVGGTRGRDGGQAFNLVHVYEHTIVHSVVLLGDTPAVGELVTRRGSPAPALGRGDPHPGAGQARGPGPDAAQATRAGLTTRNLTAAGCGASLVTVVTSPRAP